MNTSTDKTLLATVLLVCTMGVAIDASADTWQEKMLFSPSETQLEMEASRDRIMIYEGLKDTQVAMAMDQQFNRIEHMMFVGTVVTDEQGKVKVDPDTGREKVEDDGC